MEEFKPHYFKDDKKVFVKPENIRNLPWWANKNRLMLKAVFWGINSLQNSLDRVARKHNDPQQCMDAGRIISQLETIRNNILKIITTSGFDNDIFPPCKMCGYHGCDCDK